MVFQTAIIEIRNNLEKKLYPTEASVCDNIVRRFLHEGLGWPQWKDDVVAREYPVEGGRVDFALCHPPSSPVVLIEVKRPGKINSAAEQQLFQYAYHEGVPILVLTDGREWHFFYSMGRGNYKDRQVCALNLTTNNIEEISDLLCRYLRYESVRNGDATNRIGKDFDEKVSKKYISETWDKLVQGPDKQLLDLIKKTTENLRGHEPTDEQVLAFLKTLKVIGVPPSINGVDCGDEVDKAPSGLTVKVNGVCIKGENATDTFVEVIENKNIGIERVKELELINQKLPLIVPRTDWPTETYHTKRLSKDGKYYINTQGDPKKMKRLLMDIASKLPDISLEL